LFGRLALPASRLGKWETTKKPQSSEAFLFF
jgi:hypothetical protein